MQKSISKIGPFLLNGKLMEENPCEILKSQYEKVFSISSEKFKVSDPVTFFAPVYNCMDCHNEFTHFCPLDLDETQ